MIRSMKKSFFFLAAHVLMLVLFISPLVIFAQSNTSSTNPPDGGPNTSSTNPPPASIKIEIKNPLEARGVDTIYEFIRLIINDLVLPLGALLAVLYIIYAGFLLVTARGDESQISRGKTAFTNAAIGTAILLGAWVIVQVVENTINSITGAV